MPNTTRVVVAGRRLLKATLPPILFDALKERQRRYYSTFAQAQEASAGSWESNALTRFRIEEALQNLPLLQSRELPAGYSLLLASLAMVDTPTPHICDLGGGCGAWGYRLARDANRPFHYDVVEHPGLVAACNAEPFFSWGSWTTELPAAWDVLLCSGTLQCLANPYELLSAALRRTRQHAILTRTTMSEKDYVQVQVSSLQHNGHRAPVPQGYDPDQRVYYPHRTVRLSQVLSVAAAEGFELTLKLPRTPSALAPRAFEQDMLFTRKGK